MEIYNRRRSRAVGNPEHKIEETVLPDKFLCGQVWISACAGMTAKMFLFEIYYKRSSEIFSDGLFII